MNMNWHFKRIYSQTIAGLVSTIFCYKFNRFVWFEPIRFLTKILIGFTSCIPPRVLKTRRRKRSYSNLGLPSHRLKPFLFFSKLKLKKYSRNIGSKNVFHLHIKIKIKNQIISFDRSLITKYKDVHVIKVIESDVIPNKIILIQNE